MYETTLLDFDQFYSSARERLVVQIAALTGDVPEAQDHVQEAFVSAWCRWQKVGRYDDPEGWVRRCAYHLAVSRWRKARRLVLRPDVPEHTPDASDGEVAVIMALRRLPERERRALVLHSLVGMPVAAVASELSVPEGTVKSWLARGRLHLSAELTSIACRTSGDEIDKS